MKTTLRTEWRLGAIIAGVLLCFTALASNTSFSQTWNSIPGANGPIYAMLYDAANGWLYVGGNFTMVGSVPANRIARWNGATWSSLGIGMNGTVRALSFGIGTTAGNVIAAGDFTTAGGNTANRIAQWNGAAWSGLATGMNDVVCALTPFTYYNNTPYLVAGGNFTTAGGVSANRLALWSGSVWSAVGSGVNDTVFALAAPPITSYYFQAGGAFTMYGTFSNARRVANFYPFGLYGQLGAGIDNGTCYALAYFPAFPNLFVGGSFTMIGGVPINRIAMWNGNWNLVGAGTNNTVYSLFASLAAQPGTNVLCVGGLFTTAGGISANSIARWNGSSWGTFGTGMSGGSPTNVLAISDFRAILSAAGNFTSAGGTSVSNAALWGSMPGTPAPLSPSCGSTVPTLTPTLDWTDVSNAWRYGVQVASDPNFNNVIVSVSNLSSSQYTIGTGQLQNGATYYWRANAANGLGTGSWSSICWFSTVVGININTSEIPAKFKLYQNYPNPFNPVTLIKFDIPAGYRSESSIVLALLDASGRKLNNIISLNYVPGKYEVTFNASGLSSGVYFYKLSAGGYTQSSKMVVMR
jgi:hypothetical protein